VLVSGQIEITDAHDPAKSEFFIEDEFKGFHRGHLPRDFFNLSELIMYMANGYL